MSARSAINGYVFMLRSGATEEQNDKIDEALRDPQGPMWTDEEAWASFVDAMG